MREAARKSPGLTETGASSHVRIAKAIATSSIGCATPSWRRIGSRDFGGISVTISESNRAQFQLIGRDRIAHALATGTIRSIEISESKKSEASEWGREQDTERDLA
jgi:hypothetical protein